MAEIKLNIGDSKSKKTYTKVIDEASLSLLKGKKIGESFKGELIDLPGYEMQITGGSDSSGFPMRKDVSGYARRKILIVGGVGLRTNKRDGRKVRKSVAGNTIYEKTAQINLKVTKWGEKPIVPVAEAPAEEASKTE
ncbi:MAG: S6e family ribosomal protein [Candidatus Woesearchaeota archaeon]